LRLLAGFGRSCATVEGNFWFVWIAGAAGHSSVRSRCGPVWRPGWPARYRSGRRVRARSGMRAMPGRRRGARRRWARCRGYTRPFRRARRTTRRACATASSGSVLGSAAVRGLPRRGARLPAPCEHQQGLHQHGASIMQRKPLPSGGIRADKAAPRPVRDGAERTQALRPCARTWSPPRPTCGLCCYRSRRECPPDSGCDAPRSEFLAKQVSIRGGSHSSGLSP
jgi:hypothetical protein